ncbi:MAG: tRNA (adenosine(37)-N6)-dimethylallyltransferase MiaA [Chthoniobacterales bacterium]|nr:tRNA (adenosine(37)-N6)-dimethylallyltransferase MiaA [Chthoniobacterales bacterium]
MNTAFFIVGPTASGKSQIAADLAERCGGEVISADALQIYRGLPLLTAQPNETLLSQAPHHLLAAFPLTEEMSAAKFRELALHALAEIYARGKRVFVVGGSGLYLKALTHGLAPLPPVDQLLREELNGLSLDELQEQLTALDPLGAATIDRRNKRRIVRALEICAQTNAPASAQRKEWKSEATSARGVFVFRDRAELNTRIDRRVEEMFRGGVVEEVAAIKQLGATAAKTLGLREIQRLLAGEISEAECISTIQQATRRYAKRQLTWFRRQTNFEPLNLSLLKDHEAAVDWILQKAERSFAPAE